MRLPAGVVVSRTSERASPPPLVPAVQSRPPLVERNRPLEAPRYRVLLLAGSTMMTLMNWPVNKQLKLVGSTQALPVLAAGKPDPSEIQLLPPSVDFIMP